jgi:hypothetical protein
LGFAESWGHNAHPDALSEYCIQKLDEKVLIDIAPINFIQTWRNKRKREEYIAKIMDRFLVSKNLMESPLSFKQWVGFGGESNHHPIIMEVARR